MIVTFFEHNYTIPIFQFWCEFDVFEDIVNKIGKENIEVPFVNERDEEIYIDENFVTTVWKYFLKNSLIPERGKHFV